MNYHRLTKSGVNFYNKNHFAVDELSIYNKHFNVRLIRNDHQ